MPSGNVAAPEITDNKDGTVTIRYHPTEPGMHELHVKYNSDAIEGSPFRFHVDQVSSGQVTAYGPGLSHAASGEEARFTIVTKDAGSGGLSVSIEGPSKADIHCKDNKDGTCSVSYLPLLSGEYQISIKFKGQHIKGSPFTCKASSAGRKKTHLSVGSSSEISLKVTEADISNLTAVIKTPQGKEEPSALKRLANGHLGISFTPKIKGEHKVNVTRYGKHIQGSPFNINVAENEVGNAKKVKTSGKALTEGMAGQLNEFTVDTSAAGYGGLSLSIEGPSKAEINCTEAGNGKCNVNYKPSEPGSYIINVKYADEHVTGSPFLVKVGGQASGRQIETIKQARAQEKDAQVGQPCELLLNVPGASPFDLESTTTNPSGVSEFAEVKGTSGSVFAIRFTPQEVGMHGVAVKHKGMHIPGSPFQFTVGQIQGGGAYKVRAGGPGLEKGEINTPCEFDIYTREAGAGNLSIAIEGSSKAQIKFQDRKNGTCGVTYSAAEVGDYIIAIKFNDEHIPDSPFRVPIGPQSGDAKLVTVHSLQTNGLQLGKAYTFSARLNGAKGRLSAFTVLPSGQEEDCFYQEINDGEYVVRMTPQKNGQYYVHVLLNGYDIPGSPFRCVVGTVDADPGKVTAYGEGLNGGKTGEVCKFIVNTCNAGAGPLHVGVEGPSKVQLNCKEVDEGYKFYWTPTAPGDYLVSVKFAGNTHIIGSPWKVHITGQGKATGFKEEATLDIETVAKSSTTSTKKAGAPKLKSNANKCTAKGNGLNKAFVNKKAMFTVDTRGAGDNAIFAGIVGPQGTAPVDEMNIKHTARTVYTVSYTMKERGEYFLFVKYGDDHIPGSPFTLEVV